MYKNYQIKNFQINTKVGDKNNRKTPVLTVDSRDTDHRPFVCKTYMFNKVFENVKKEMRGGGSFRSPTRHRADACPGARERRAGGRKTHERDEGVFLREHPRRERRRRTLPENRHQAEDLRYRAHRAREPTWARGRRSEDTWSIVRLEHWSQ